MRHLIYIYTALLLLCSHPISSFAQASGVNAQELYNQALKVYEQGLFNQCEELTLSMLPSADDMLKTSGYRLLTLCCIEKGDMDGARLYAEKMLRTNPYFTPTLGDPHRFIDLVAEIKSAEAGITTASRQAEAIEEAPVPVTLITEDMIRYSGATTLQDLLALYVPGFTVAEGMESNIAMHGIYSLTQDKILFMLDGHRLNSSSTNAEAPDFRSSLDKIKQIEVLRGPASSLYGNVALTAVVNIITRKGAELNGGRVSATIGTANTYGGSFVVGGGNNVVDIMGWGSLQYMEGFPDIVDNNIGGTTTLYSHGFRGRPAYDVGIKARWQDFTLSLNIQRSKHTPYINVIQLPNDQSVTDAVRDRDPDVNAFRNFSYDKYAEIDGITPGVSRSNNRINLDYSHSFEGFDLQASGYISLESSSLYNALGDSIDRGLGVAMLLLLSRTTRDAGEMGDAFVNSLAIVAENPFTQGAYQKMDWDGVTYGFQAQGLTSYKALGEGSLVFGAQYENFVLANGNLLIGGNYNAYGALYSNAIFQDGNETSMSGYAQLKHFFMPRTRNLIFNAGLRFDRKVRFNEKVLTRLSPRFSLIYKLSDHLSLRGNYNYSFVDAAYIYRASILSIFAGGSDMKPETMRSFNIGASYHNPRKHFNADVSVFYNILKDLAVLNASMRNDFEHEDYMFINTGKVRNLGVDVSAQYNHNDLFVNMNATWQRILTSENYIEYDSQTFSTPEFHTNMTVAGCVWHNPNRKHQLWARSTVQFRTATFYQSLDLIRTFIQSKFISEIYRVKPQCDIGLGLSYTSKVFDVDLSLKNLLNNQYKIGSMLIDGIPHAGRQFIGKVTFKF